MSLNTVAWIGLMLDREQARRGTRRFQSRLRAANLRHGDACMENVDYRTPTGPSHAPVTASLVAGAAPGTRVPPVDNPPRHQHP